MEEKSMRVHVFASVSNANTLPCIIMDPTPNGFLSDNDKFAVLFILLGLFIVQPY